MSRTKKTTVKKQERVTKVKSPSARTPNQKEYIKSIIGKDVTFCQGPAGTGKTHLAIGMGIFALHQNAVSRIVVARPVVEAGEQIGFLPGDIDHKMDPFVRPIFDELHEYVSYTDIVELRNSKRLEIVPIGFMRGRTFKDAFVICDECQNLELDQMKMLTTRFGLQSKIVLTGDVHQSDLPHNKQGAFAFYCALFKDDPEIGTVFLDTSDIQRHKLVWKMLEKVQKYEKYFDNFQKTGTITPLETV